MSAQHTQGPFVAEHIAGVWVIKQGPTAEWTGLDRGPWRGPDGWLQNPFMATPFVLICMPGNTPRDEADARRIVACLNACEGISTEALESERYLQTASYAMRQCAEAQRDELLAALQRAAANLAICWHPDTWASDPAAIQIRDAIAKATGGVA